MASKVSRPMIYGVLGIIIVGGFALSGEEPRSTGPSLAELRAGRSSGKSNQAAQVFDERDRTARFDRLNERPRNAFNPLVARHDAQSGSGLAPNEFPASYTGGEVGWFYTGTVIVDDVPSALVENEKTGEGMFLMVGERLKRAVIAQITPTYIVVKNAAGQTMRLDLLRDRAEPGEEFEGFGIEPVRPDGPGFMTGPIRFDGQESPEQQ